MFQWFRNSEGRLVKISILQEFDSELGLNLNTMEPPSKEQLMSPKTGLNKVHMEIEIP